MRQAPVCTSSKIRTVPVSVQMRRSSCKKPGGGRLMPPSAWIGSTITAHVSLVTAARTAAVSPNGRKRTGPTSGPNPSRYLAWPVTLSAPNVRPWKLCSKAISSTRWGCFLATA